MDGAGKGGAKSLMDHPRGAGVACGWFSAPAIGWYCQAGRYSILDIDLLGDQPGGIRVAGVYRGSAGEAKMVCNYPAGGNQHTDVLSVDLYSFCYFKYVAGQLEITRRIKER